MVSEGITWGIRESSKDGTQRIWCLHCDKTCQQTSDMTRHYQAANHPNLAAERPYWCFEEYAHSRHGKFYLRSSLESEDSLTQPQEPVRMPTSPTYELKRSSTTLTTVLVSMPHPSVLLVRAQYAWLQSRIPSVARRSMQGRILRRDSRALVWVDLSLLG
jgi:hypothetical protein